MYAYDICAILFPNQKKKKIHVAAKNNNYNNNVFIRIITVTEVSFLYEKPRREEFPLGYYECLIAVLRAVVELKYSLLCRCRCCTR